jgi:hypothetical protein
VTWNQVALVSVPAEAAVAANMATAPANKNDNRLRMGFVPSVLFRFSDPDRRRLLRGAAPKQCASWVPIPSRCGRYYTNPPESNTKI